MVCGPCGLVFMGSLKRLPGLLLKGQFASNPNPPGPQTTNESLVDERLMDYGLFFSFFLGGEEDLQRN